MATVPYLIKYVKPFLTGIANVIDDLCTIPEFKEFSSNIRKCKICDNLLALPPVSYDDLLKLVSPCMASYITLTSKRLVLKKGKKIFTIHIVPDIWSYAVVIESGNKKKVKVLGASPQITEALGTRKLFDFLKKSGLILSTFEAYQPKCYGVLDFDMLYHELKQNLCENVSIEIQSTLPSKKEIENEHFYSIYLDKHGSCIDIINLKDSAVLVFLMIYNGLPQEFEKYGFEKIEPAFFEPSEVISELMENLNL